jgi:hypothetical protein
LIWLAIALGGAAAPVSAAVVTWFLYGRNPGPAALSWVLLQLLLEEVKCLLCDMNRFGIRAEGLQVVHWVAILPWTMLESTGLGTVVHIAVPFMTTVS